MTENLEKSTEGLMIAMCGALGAVAGAKFMLAASQLAGAGPLTQKFFVETAVVAGGLVATAGLVKSLTHLIKDSR